MSARTDAAAAIVPGKPERSPLVARIESRDENEVMPPPSAKKPLSAAQKETLRAWIAQGADFAAHWAFVPPTRPVPPAVKDEARVRNPIDRFVQARLEAEGLAPSPEAPREVLLRRVTLDLTGLPPTRDELDAFLADRSPHAYERVVDRLLISPRHAERMAAHWLDVARYADTNGYNNDEERTMWPWRDWVIDAFRRNLPYDRFVVEQLAGDLLPGATLDQKIATGFNRNHVLTTEGGIIEDEYRVEYVADRVHTTSTVFLGLSMQCARCHDHKYDPFTMRDYYGLFAFFNRLPDTGVGYNKGGVAPPFVQAPSASQSAELATLAARAAEIERTRQDRSARADALVAAWEASLTPDDRAKLANHGPMHHFPLDEAASDTVADAASVGNRAADAGSVGHGKAGRIHGKAAWTAGKVGGALEFDGTTHVDFGQIAAFDAGDRFSFAAWVWPAANEPITLLSKMDDAEAFRGYDVILEGGKVATHVVDAWPAVGLKVITNDALPLNQWRHVAVTYDGSRKAAGVSIYVDGKPQALTVMGDTLASKPNSTLKTDKPFHLGKRQASVPFKGKIDDVRIFAGTLLADDAARLAAGKPVSRLADLLAIPAEKRTAEQRAEMRRVWLDQIDPETRRMTSDLAALAARRAEIEKALPSVMVMEDSQHRETRLLKRGQYDQPGDVVSPSVPAAFAALVPWPHASRPDATKQHAAGDLKETNAASANRRHLAEWLVAPNHPLTARVAVNRYWELLFGTGLVETSEDFGVTGALPSHPELLDWLAVEFSEGVGIQGSGFRADRTFPESRILTPALSLTRWDIRRILRTIVTSATYRQASDVTAVMRERDPKNQLLARASRLRLSAEAVRDHALAVSGLLVERAGGPSVKPYQPDGLWEDVSVERKYKYVVDPGDGLYRRTMYTFWKRTCPPPTLATFDAPTRETCTVRRARTNTPLQALVLLNDPTYVEAARKLAERVLRGATAGDGVAANRVVPARLDDAFRRVTSRKPDDDERATLSTLLTLSLAAFERDPDAAAKLLAVGRAPADAALPALDLAAWTAVCATLLNLDAAITRE